MTGWSQYSAGPAGSYLKLDRDLFAAPGHHLGQGPTAYYGKADVAAVGEGDVVFVSGAAGGVGSLAGQIAKCLGAARVIGSAGSPAKADYLVNELGYDAAFDYHDGPAAQRLKESHPRGSLCSSTSWAVSSTTLRCRRPGPGRASPCAAPCRASSATRRSASRSPTARRPRRKASSCCPSPAITRPIRSPPGASTSAPG
ncbi:zinc-binding dehydrogenase [Streptomyces sp. NPDC017964]|uniref:zinc-binding dehydrogenase n=1 Tax=Streptomyces sp. NPDC017964 TaxID=3365022 RepID=UPI00378F6BA2